MVKDISVSRSRVREVGGMLNTYTNWCGSGDELVAIVHQLQMTFLGTDKPLKRRTLDYYRTKGVISAPLGKKYAYVHILQFLLARKYASQGWTIKQLGEYVHDLDIKECLKQLGLDEQEEVLPSKAKKHFPQQNLERQKAQLTNMPMVFLNQNWQ